MPTTCSPYADELPARDKIVDAYAADHLRAADRHLRFATGGLGVRIPPGATILDFGCGIGTSVGVLLAQGYDAFGVDVLEYWDRDFDKYWHIAEKPSAGVAARLRLADPADYRLPFADATFDFCFSDQVFEHVFDYAATMSEIARVLKPGAISVHHFPGPNNFMEGHVGLAFPWLCHSRSYLALCAWVGWLRGVEPDWRARLKSYTEIMRFNNYPTKAKLRRIARETGVDIRFAEADEFMFRGGGRAAPMLRRLRKVHMDRLAAQVAGLVLFQRYMVLKARS
ncbi:MAG: class I SAM-dependent methyltransferase [Xanthobacteraceae bacterium]